jgi:MarR family transcriptional regulator, organic hydroperoxide resistance regulator
VETKSEAEPEGSRGRPGSEAENIPLLIPLGRAFRAMSGLFERETGTGAPTWLLLAMLGREDGLSQGEVSEAFCVDPSRLSRLGQALEEEGLVRRERDAGDNRVVRMYLTEAGKKRLRELPRLEREFRRRIHEALGEEGVGEMRQKLISLAAAMERG